MSEWRFVKSPWIYRLSIQQRNNIRVHVVRRSVCGSWQVECPSSGLQDVVVARKNNHRIVSQLAGCRGDYLLWVARRMRPARTRVPIAAAPPTRAIPIYPSVNGSDKLWMQGRGYIPRLTPFSISWANDCAWRFVGSFSIRIARGSESESELQHQ